MFHKINNVTALKDYKLSIQFAEGATKIYNVKHLIETNKMFEPLKNNELFENGKNIKTPFDGLMALSDATIIWGLNESTLRKAISYGKLIYGIDVCKYGKQWIISIDAMKREYGIPKEK